MVEMPHDKQVKFNEKVSELVKAAKLGQSE
jgi:hypothetical protein